MSDLCTVRTTTGTGRRVCGREGVRTVAMCVHEHVRDSFMCEKHATEDSPNYCLKCLEPEINHFCILRITERASA